MADLSIPDSSKSDSADSDDYDSPQHGELSPSESGPAPSMSASLAKLGMTLLPIDTVISQEELASIAPIIKDPTDMDHVCDELFLGTTTPRHPGLAPTYAQSTPPQEARPSPAQRKTQNLSPLMQLQQDLSSSLVNSQTPLDENLLDKVKEVSQMSPHLVESLDRRFLRTAALIGGEWATLKYEISHAALISIEAFYWFITGSLHTSSVIKAHSHVDLLTGLSNLLDDSQSQQLTLTKQVKGYAKYFDHLAEQQNKATKQMEALISAMGEAQIKLNSIQGVTHKTTSVTMRSAASSVTSLIMNRGQNVSLGNLEDYQNDKCLVKVSQIGKCSITPLSQIYRSLKSLEALDCGAKITEILLNLDLQKLANFLDHNTLWVSTYNALEKDARRGHLKQLLSVIPGKPGQWATKSGQ